MFSRKRKNPVNLNDVLDLEEGSVRTGEDGLTEAISEVTKIPMHHGEVKHGYSLAHAGDSDTCPQCGAGTEQRYADFIYSTNSAPRIMAAPAGYFCTQCPTVIVDEDMIRDGVRGPYRFRAICGIGAQAHPHLFKTWNDAKTIYILNEEGGLEDMMTKGDLPPDVSLSSNHPATSSNRSPKHKRRKQLARKSRKQNRRR